MTPETIIHAYSQWELEDGIEKLIDYRKELSIALTRIAIEIGKLEQESGILYSDRKIAYSERFLINEGTAAQRGEQAQVDTKEIRTKEAQVSGKLKGAKIYYESLCKVLDSMSSYINYEKRL